MKRIKRAFTIRKQDIDQDVAKLSDCTLEDIRGVTSAFLHSLKEHLVKGDEVYLEGFGTFHVFIQTGKANLKTVLTQGNGQSGERVGTTVVSVKKKYYVGFRRARVFREMFKEIYGKQKVVKRMDKYGVDESGSEQEKLAAQGCPVCGAKVERHGNVLACPVHGTEPFEGEKK